MTLSMRLDAGGDVFRDACHRRFPAVAFAKAERLAPRPAVEQTAAPALAAAGQGARSAVSPNTSINLKQEQARLEDLYQSIFPYLLQTERVLQEVATRGKGMIPEVVNYVVQAGGKRLRPALGGPVRADGRIAGR